MASFAGTATVKVSIQIDELLGVLPKEHADKIAPLGTKTLKDVPAWLAPSSWVSEYSKYIAERKVESRLFRDLYEQDMFIRDDRIDAIGYIKPQYLNSSSPTATQQRLYSQNFGAYVDDFFSKSKLSAGYLNDLQKRMLERIDLNGSSNLLDAEDLCEVCRGSGVHQGEECWHCEGEGIDPTK